jgi:starch-binding outer membrane protein, SusD/RagB family
MKNIFNKILIPSLLLFTLGCANLDESPIGILSPEGFYRTKKDVESGVFGAYGILASEPLYGRQFTSALMLRSDMSDIGNRSTTADRIQVNDFAMDASNAMVGRFWRSWYTVVGAANAAEAGAVSLNLPDAEINPLIAEARFVRAFSYYHLVRCFGDIPYFEKPVSDPESVKSISKTKEADVYKKIIADLEFAKQWLPDKQANDVRTRGTKGAAATYLASVYMTNGDFQKAYTEAKFVIDNRDKFGYRLETDYQDLFRAERGELNKEIIFAVDFLSRLTNGDFNQDLLPAMVAPQNLAGGFGVNVPTLRVYQTWDARDYRKKVSFLDTLVVNGVVTPYTRFQFAARPHIDKWRRFPGILGQADGRDSDYNYPDFRYAEVLLIAAEALAETVGVNAEALGYVNQVRARARNAAGRQNTFPANVTGTPTKDEFINLVMEERRLELSFEFKRWYDIKRRKLGDQAFKSPNALEPRPNFDANRDYLFPIPKTEIDLNPNLNPQNTGY